MPAGLKKILIKGFFALVGILLVSILLVGLNRKHFFNLFKNRIENEITKSLGGKLVFDNLSISFFPASLSAQNIIVTQKGFNLKIQEAEMNFSFLSLFSEKIFIKKLKLNKPVISLEQDLLNKQNTSSVAINSQLRDVGFVVRQVELVDSTVFIKIDENHLGIDNINMKIQPDLLFTKAKVDFSTGKINLKYGNIEKTFLKSSVRLNLTKDLLAIKGIRASNDKVSLKVSGDITNFKEPSLDLFVSVESKLSELVTTSFPVDGSLVLSCTIKGGTVNPEFRGIFEMKSAVAWGFDLNQLSGRFVFQDKNFQLEELKVDSAYGSAFSSMDINVNSTPFYSGRLDLKNLDLSVFEGKFEGYPLNSKVSGGLNFKGSTLKNLQVEGWVNALRVDNASVPGNNKKIPFFVRGLVGDIKSIYADFNYLPEKTIIKSGLLKNDNFTLHFFGDIKSDDVNMNLIGYSSAISKIIDYFTIPLLGDDGTLVGRVYGSYDNLKVKSTIWGKDIHFMGENMGDLKGGLTYDSMRLGFENVVSHIGETEYWLNGGIDFVRDENLKVHPELHIDFSATKAMPNTFLRIYYQELPIFTPVTGTGYVTNIDTGSPGLFKVGLDLNLEQGSIYDQQLDRGRILMEIDHKKIVFSEGKAFKDDDSVSIKGIINYRGGYEVELVTNGLEFANIYMFNSIAPAISGRIKGKLFGKGRFDKSILDAEIVMEDSVTFGVDIGRIEGKLSLVGRKVFYHLTKNEELDLTGELNLDGIFPYNGEMIYSTVDFSQKLYGQYFDIKASGFSRYDGNFRDPESFKAVIEASTMNIKGDDLGVISNEGNITADFTMDGLSIRDANLKGVGSSFSVQGKTRHDNVSCFIEGDLKLSSFKRFFPSIKVLDGDARFSLEITNTLDDPEIVGEAFLEDGHIELNSFSETLAFSGVKLAFNKKNIVMEYLKGEILRGKITGDASFDITDFNSIKYQAYLQVEKIKPLALKKFKQSSIDGTFMVEGEKNIGKITGEVFINVGEYDKRQEWSEFAFNRNTLGGDSLGPASLMELNLRITTVESLRVRNNLAKINLDADLLVKGSVAKPIVMGRIETLEGGTISFRGNDFNVTSGVLNFQNTLQTEPVLDFLAKTTVKEFPDPTNPRLYNEYDIALRITTLNDRLELELESTPYLSYTDILALLTIGLTAEGVAGASGQIGTTEAIIIVAGALQQEIESNVEVLTGINRFQINPYYSNTRSAFGPLFTVGKNFFGDRLTVSYSTTLDFSEEQFTEVEYFIDDNLSLVGERDEAGRVGGELQYRFRFE